MTRRIGFAAFAVALVVATLGPVLWLLSVSLKTQEEFAASPFGPPTSLRLDSFSSILADPAFLRFAVNSLIVTVASVLVIVVLSTLAGYALARLDFHGHRLLFLVYLLGNAIPIFLILIPLFVLLVRTGLGGTLVSLILAYTAASMGISVLILRGFFRSLPAHLEDAARLDGCNTVRVIAHVMAPLIRPGVVVVAVFNAINIWNEYFLAAFLLPSQELFTLPPGLAASFANEYATNWPGMAAGILLSAVPLIALFVLAHKKIVEGFAFSGQ